MERVTLLVLLVGAVASLGLGLGCVARAQAPDCSVTLSANNGLGGLRVNNGSRARIRDSTIRGHRAQASSSNPCAATLNVGVSVGHDSHLRLVVSVVENNGSFDVGSVIMNAGVVAGVVGPPSKEHPAGSLVVRGPSLAMVDSQIVANHLGVLLGPQTEMSMTGSVIQGSAGWGLPRSLPPCIEGDWPGFADFQTVQGHMVFGRGNRIHGDNASEGLDGQGNPGTHPFHDLPEDQVCLP